MLRGRGDDFENELWNSVEGKMLNVGQLVRSDGKEIWLVRVLIGENNLVT